MASPQKFSELLRATDILAPVAVEQSGAVAHAHGAAAESVRERLMRELVRTNDPVLLSFVRALLDEAGIAYDVFDQHTSNTLFWLETIQARLMVASVQYDRAVVVMTSAGLEGHIHDPD